MKKRTKVSAEFNMSSLTDIIFLLLIFFMLTSSLVSPTAINLRLPSTSKSKPNKTQVNQPLKIQVNQQKELKFNGNLLAMEELRSTVANAVANSGKAPSDLVFTLAIHQDVDAQTLVTLVDLLNEFQVKMVLNTKLSD